MVTSRVDLAGREGTPLSACMAWSFKGHGKTKKKEQKTADSGEVGALGANPVGFVEQLLGQELDTPLPAPESQQLLCG